MTARLKQKLSPRVTAVIASPQGRGNLLVQLSESYIVPGDRHGLRPRDDMAVEVCSFYRIRKHFGVAAYCD